MSIEEIRKTIGYGFGTTVGYTNDGTVFVVSDHNDEDGRPMQSISEFAPSRARGLAKSLIQAAKDAEKASKAAH